MSHDGIPHEITGCPKCDAEAHQEAITQRENQEREERVLSAGLVIAAAVASLAVLGLWAGVMAVLSHIG
ncbi:MULTISPECIES: hypothetical protein [unclassified Streptomyces]|uniref:hypothetical protein n=1 Tax=unclassified Streptomyces TaxID=2593676 RepID=UPI00344FD7E8